MDAIATRRCFLGSIIPAIGKLKPFADVDERNDDLSLTKNEIGDEKRVSQYQWASKSGNHMSRSSFKVELICSSCKIAVV
jgi:hypothetical protein